MDNIHCVFVCLCDIMAHVKEASTIWVVRLIVVKTLDRVTIFTVGIYILIDKHVLCWQYFVMTSLIHNETARGRTNWKIYELYALGEYKECEAIIESTLYASRGQSEYAIYVKGLISRLNGNIMESLELFQAATALNPHNLSNLKQVARSLYLLGRYQSAIAIYDKSLEINEDDWEIWHNRGLCVEHLKNYDDAVECYLNANSVQRHDSTFLRLAHVYELQNDSQSAVETLKEALEFSPENPKLLTTLGLLYLNNNNTFDAFDTLGASLTLDGTNPRTILAAGSIIQKAQDNDVALVKYRIAAVKTPNNARLWNNIGLCFYGRTKYLESVSSLSKAVYLNPFNSDIIYNLGLVYLATSQYASAFQQFSASINLNSKHYLSFMYLGVSLIRLNDFDNGMLAFQRSVQLIEQKKSSNTSSQQTNNNDKNNGNSKANNVTNEELMVNEVLIRINYILALVEKIARNNQIIQEIGFNDANDDDDSDDNPNNPAFLAEQSEQYKQEIKTNMHLFEKLWNGINNETKLTEFSTLQQTRNTLLKLFSLDNWKVL